MELKLSILDSNVNYKPSSNVEKVVTLNTNDIVSIKNYLSNTVHSPYIWNNNYRERDNFNSTSALFVDFDESITLEEWKNSIFYKYNQIIYVSRSHQVLKNEKLNDRFHVLFLLENEMNERKDVEKMLKKMRNLMHNLGFTADKCVDVARLIYPSRYENGKVNPYFDETFVCNTKFEFITLEKVENLFIELNIDDEYVDDTKVQTLSQLSDTTYKLEENFNVEYNLKEALKLILESNVDVDHDVRFSVACALYSHFGEAGKDYLMGIKNSEGTIRCWKSARTGRYNEKFTIGSIFFLANRLGFKYLSNYEIMKREVDMKFDSKFDILVEQLEGNKQNEKKLLQLNLQTIEKTGIEQENEILSEINSKFSQLFMDNSISEETREVQTKALQVEKKNKINDLQQKISIDKKDVEKKLLGIDSEYNKKLEKGVKEIEKEKTDEIKRREKEYKKELKLKQEREKLNMISSGVSDLRRFVGDNYTQIWEKAKEDHKECKIFITADGKFSKLIKFSDKGEFGAVTQLKGLEWSGVVETNSKYEYKITSGFFSPEGKEIVDTNFDDIDYTTTTKILNDEFNKYDPFYMRGEVRLQVLPNLRTIHENGEQFETLFRHIFGGYSEFLLQFLAMVVFEDRKEARPIVVINGARGTGKSLYMSLFKYLYAENVKEYNDGQFNTYATAKIVTVDEKYSNRKELWDTIKRTTGNKTVSVRQLYANPVDCDSISYFIVASNDRPIKITETPASSKDNQTYAVTLTKPVSHNKPVQDYLKEFGEVIDTDIARFLTNRLGAWLKTKGLEIYKKILDDRENTQLRYGIKVPITKTLLDWCETGYPDEMKRQLKVTADLMKEENSDITQALKMGYLSRSFYHSMAIDEILMIEFFIKIKDKAILDTQKTSFYLNGVKKMGFKLRNAFQLIMWLSPFLDETDVIEDLMKEIIIKVDDIHYEVREFKGHTDVPPPDNTPPDKGGETKSITENVTKVEISEVKPQITNEVSSAVTKVEFDVNQCNNKQLKYLYSVADKFSMFNFNILQQEKDYETQNITNDVTDVQMESFKRQSFNSQIKLKKVIMEDEILSITEDYLTFLNNSATHDKKRFGALFIQLLKDKSDFGDTLNDNEFRDINTTFVYNSARATEEILNSSNIFYNIKKCNNLYDFYKTYQDFNPYMTLEVIKNKLPHLFMILGDLEIDLINCSKNYLFIMFYMMFA